MHFLHQLVAGHGRQKGGQGPSWILKCDIFLLNFLRKKVFLVSRRKKKIPPLWPPHGKIPSDAHTIGIHCLNLVSFSLRNAWLCCNLAGGVALIVWFTTNGICAKNKNIYAWCEQAIIEWSWHVNSIVACCHSAKLCAYAARDFRSQQLLLCLIPVRNKFVVFPPQEWCLQQICDCFTNNSS